jgi:hypothetical protein
MKREILVAAITVLAGQTAWAHVTYTNRDFGIFQANGLDAPVTIAGQTVSSNFGWADATDSDYGDSHRTRAFRFTLANAGLVTIQITGGTGLLPAFSIYAGLCHVGPALADHDTTTASVDYLNGLGTGPKEGALFALGHWAIGNDDGLLSFLTYKGHAADGTAANFGTAPGIQGDGVADNQVTGTFALPAGDYSLFIGGADYSTQGPAPYTNYAITPTVSVVPEPTCTLLLGAGGLALVACRRHRAGLSKAKG